MSGWVSVFLEGSLYKCGITHTDTISPHLISSQLWLAEQGQLRIVLLPHSEFRNAPKSVKLFYLFTICLVVPENECDLQLGMA